MWISRKKIQITLFAVFILIAVSGGAWASFKSNDISCIGLIVDIEDSLKFEFVKDKDIADRISKANLNPYGLSYRNISTESIERSLEDIPFLEKAECYKTLSGFVRVDVCQKVPILHIKTVGLECYMDAKGEFLPISRFFSANVPILTSDTKISKDFIRNNVYDFVEYVHSHKFWKAMVEQVHISVNGTISFVPRVGRNIVILGTQDRYEQKLKKLESIYSEVFPKTGWNKYSKIDLSFKDQVVCTLRQ